MFLVNNCRKRAEFWFSIVDAAYVIYNSVIDQGTGGCHNYAHIVDKEIDFSIISLIISWLYNIKIDRIDSSNDTN